MMHRTRLHDMDAAKQAYQFGRNSFRKDVLTGTTTRNPYLSGTMFHRAFEEGRRLEQASLRAPDAGHRTSVKSAEKPAPSLGKRTRLDRPGDTGTFAPTGD